MLDMHNKLVHCRRFLHAKAKLSFSTWIADSNLESQREKYHMIRKCDEGAPSLHSSVTGQVFGVPEKYRRNEEICNTGQVDLSQNISSPLASQKSDTDRNIGKLLNREFIHSFIFLSFVSYVFSRVSFIIFSTRCTHGLKGGREGGREEEEATLLT